MTKIVGSYAQVYKGTATHTSGGLTKADIFFDERSGTYKSKAKSQASAGNPWSEAVGIWMRAQTGHKTIPKKGTRQHANIMKIYKSLSK